MNQFMSDWINTFLIFMGKHYSIILAVLALLVLVLALVLSIEWKSHDKQAS